MALLGKGLFLISWRSIFIKSSGRSRLTKSGWASIAFYILFTRILNSSHYLDMIAFAEFFELRGDIEDICFYIGRGAYFHPFLQSRYIGGIYFNLHFRSDSDKFFQHFRVCKPEEAFIFISFWRTNITKSFIGVPRFTSKKCVPFLVGCLAFRLYGVRECR